MNDSSIPSKLQSIIPLSGCLVSIMGLLVMIGWFLHLPGLIEINPAFNSMKFNTALGFFSSGIGIFFILRPQKIMTALMGVLLIVLGTMTLWQYLTGINLNIDQLFMQDYLTASSQFPGRMAPQTALCFFLFGSGLLIDRLVRQRKLVMFWRCFCGAFLFVIGTTAIFGYFSHIPFAYTWGSYNALAVHTTIGLCLLGIAMMLTCVGNAYISLVVISLGGLSLGLQVCYGLLQYEDPYIKTLVPWLLLFMILLFTAWVVVSIYSQIKHQIAIEKIVAGGLVIALVLFIGVGILSNYHEKQLTEDTLWVDHTYNVLLQLKDLFADVKTGARSFILTGDERDLEPYKLAVTHIIYPMNEVRHLTVDNPIQQKRLNLVEPLIKEKFAITNKLIALKRSGAPTDFLLLARGSDILVQLRTFEYDLENEEYRLLNFRALRAEATNKIAGISMNIGSMLAFLIIFIAFITMFRDNRARHLAEEEVKKLSTTDDLTGLYNRRGFKFLVDQKMKEARRSKQANVLFLIDLDQMKKINDQFGHNAGDLALIDTAKLLNKSFREADIISRWGGDEFVILAVDTSDKDIPAIKQRLEANINEYNLNSNNGFKLSMSAGEFMVNHDVQSSLEALIVEADKKMYQQKKTSRSQA